MAQNPLHEHAQPQATFLARLLVIPFIHDIIAYVQGHYHKIKHANGGIKIFFSATENSVKLVFSCFWFMTTPLIDLVGSWQNLDVWACQVLDRIEGTVPAIKRPVSEVATEVRRKILDSVAGKYKARVRPETLAAALHIRLNAMIEKVKGSPGSQTVARTGDGLLNRMHSILDTHSPETEADRKDLQNESSHTKATALPVKARKILLEASSPKVTLKVDTSGQKRQVLTTIEMVRLGQRRATLLYEEVDEEPSKFVIVLTIIVSLIAITAVRFATFVVYYPLALFTGSNLLVIPQLCFAIVLNILYKIGFLSALAKIQETTVLVAIWLKQNAFVMPAKKLLIILERVTREMWRICCQPVCGIVECLSPSRVDKTE